MRYPAYPRYKPSGVEWLGDVPEHWAICPLKQLAHMRAGNSIPATMLNDDGQYPVYGGNGMRGFTSDFTHDGEHVLIGRQGALCGNVSLVSGRFWASEHAVVVSPLGRTVTRWLSELLRAMDLNQYSIAAAQPGLAIDDIRMLQVAVPPSKEQHAIASFLDAQTSKLDALVAKKQALVEKLKEKRSALITRTITRGLPPDAAIIVGLEPHPKLKPSGIDWLGEVPAHWEVKRLKSHLRRIEQGWSPECEARPADDDEWGVLKVGCVNGEEFEPSEHKALPSSMAPLPEYEIRPGDILMSRANTAELLGNAVLVRATRPRLLLCDKLYRLDVKDIDTEYLALVLNSKGARFQYERDATGASSSMKNIGQDTVRNLVLPLPPLAEQRAIVTYLGKETAKIRHMVAKVRAAIDRLQEYRSALITAAVTGKIDVRRVCA